MGKILAVSSFVAHGSVGLRAAIPALSALGHEVIALPTVLLSTHPGYGRTARLPVAPAVLAAMLSALEENGVARDVAAVLTGYLPDPGHVAMAREAVALVKRLSPNAIFVCDPVFGDDPDGHYLAHETSLALGRDLLPLADVTTPNRYELAVLSGRKVYDVASAVAAARDLGIKIVVATSVPAGERRMSTLFVTPETSTSHDHEAITCVPHGTGDVLAALVTGWLASGSRPEMAVAAAHAKLLDLIARSAGRDELDLAALSQPGMA